MYELCAWNCYRKFAGSTHLLLGVSVYVFGMGHQDDMGKSMNHSNIQGGKRGRIYRAIIAAIVYSIVCVLFAIGQSIVEVHPIIGNVLEAPAFTLVVFGITRFL